MALTAFLNCEPLFSQDIPPEVPLGLPPVPWPEDNPYSAKKAELGKILYFDKRLSTDGSVSCASCHAPEEGFAKNEALSPGIQGQLGTRNAPTVINTAYQKHQFWDGRASSLEEQCKGPIANVKEMTDAKTQEEAYKACEECLYKIEGYKKLFKEAFGSDKCSIQDICLAIATFERTVLSGNSAYDRYMAGDKTAMTEQQIFGLKVFKKANCNACHGGFNFTDGRFMNIGIGMDKPNPDLGRYEITKNFLDKGAFKTPTLRDASKNYPYMHDGSLKTLEDVVDYYDKGGIPNQNLSPLIRPLHLTQEEKAALVSFLKALDGQGWEKITAPSELPK